MSIIEAIILGIIQGITEWLPVSSSGHLAIAEHLFGIAEPVGYGILLHLSSLLAVIIVLRTDIFSIAKGTIKAIMKRQTNADSDLLISVILATIPIAVIGLLFKHQIESAFSSMKIVGICLIITAIILWFTKYCKPGKTHISMKDSIFIGIFQAFAILPGISRSGSTISAALYRKIDREKAARFSLLLFIPAILGASILESRQFTHVELIPAILTAVVSFAVSILAINWLISLVKASKLHWFSIYCLVIGTIALSL